MLIPNWISVFRIITSIIGFIALLSGLWQAGTLLLVLSVLLDIVDGKVARRIGQTSKYGVYLDIMGDKIMIIGTYFILGLMLHIHLFYIAIAILVREYTMDSLRSMAAANGAVIPADRFSKLKGMLLMGSFVALLVNQSWIQSAQLQTTFILTAGIGVAFAYLGLLRFFLLHRSVLA